MHGPSLRHRTPFHLCCFVLLAALSCCWARTNADQVQDLTSAYFPTTTSTPTTTTTITEVSEEEEVFVPTAAPVKPPLAFFVSHFDFKTGCSSFSLNLKTENNITAIFIENYLDEADRLPVRLTVQGALPKQDLWAKLWIHGTRIICKVESKVKTEMRKVSNARLASEGVVDVVYAIEGDYIEGLGASMASILLNTKFPEKIRFNILTSAKDIANLKAWLIPQLNAKLTSSDKSIQVALGLGPKDYLKREDKKTIWIEVKEFDPSIVESKIKIHDHTEHQEWERLKSPLNFARFYLSQFFPRLKKFVYTDADTIIQRDLTELWERALRPKNHRGPAKTAPVFAVFSNCYAYYSSYFNFDNSYVEARFDPSECAFEAGIYVADLEEWERQGITAQLEDWMQRNRREKHYICGSQPPLMAVFYRIYDDLHNSTDWKHYISLGHTYTSTDRPLDFESLLTGSQVGVLEWNGNAKPWRDNGIWKQPWRPYRLPLSWSTFLKKQEKNLKRRELLKEHSSDHA